MVLSSTLLLAMVTLTLTLLTTHRPPPPQPTRGLYVVVALSLKAFALLEV
jgi:hypothetical protein